MTQPENNGKLDRSRIELMALQACIRFPRLLGEIGIRPEHFRLDKKREALAVALEGTKFWNTNGSAPLMDIAARAGVDREWLAAEFAASFNSVDEGRWWVERLAEAETELRLRLDVERAFKDRHGPGLMEALAEVVARHQAAAGLTNGYGTKSVHSLVSRYIDDKMEALATGKSAAIPTGFPTLDKYFKGGWRRKEVTILMARAGVGKTTLADHLRRRLAMAGWSSILFSAEMSEEQLAERQAHASAGVPLESDLTMEDLQYISKQRLGGKGDQGWLSLMEVDETPEITPGRMVARARARIAAGSPLALVVVDTLGKVRVKEQRGLGRNREEQNVQSKGGHNEYDQLTLALMAMKPVAKAIPCAVLVIHHLKEGDTAPTLSDAHGTRHVGREADNVVGIWRQHGGTYCRILKARQTRGIDHVDFTLAYDPRTQYYGESSTEVVAAAAALPPRHPAAQTLF